MKYVANVVVEYLKRITVEVPDLATERETDSIIADKAVEAIKELPDRIYGWEYDWDNVQSGGIYQDYFDIKEEMI